MTATTEEITTLEAKLAELKRSVAIPPTVVGPLKLDLGCGAPARREHNQTTKALGWVGVDVRALPGVDIVCDLLQLAWPWPDSSVDEVTCSHMVEHIPRLNRIHFFNELWRVLKPSAKVTIITPHWCSARAFGDMTHEWPPVAEYFWAYLDKKWRAENDVTDVDYLCDFTGGTQGYSEAPWLAGRSMEYKLAAFREQKAAAEDMVSVIIARK